MAGHSPGFWEVPARELAQKDDSDRTVLVKLSSGCPRYICRVYGQGVTVSARPESVANARLVAASPRLRAKLAGLLEWAKATGDTGTATPTAFPRSGPHLYCWPSLTG